MSTDFFSSHKETLERAVDTIKSRSYWSAYPEMPSKKIYGETARKDGQAAFESRLNKAFTLEMPGIVGQGGAESSPYGIELGVTYPVVDMDVLMPAMKEATRVWRDLGHKQRVGVCLEILHRINQRSFEIAFSVMHTSGQGFMMAFQAGGPHAQDRGLEALAYAYEEMQRIPESVLWEKPQGKNPALKMHKNFNIVPRGVGLVIGCATFPTWNTYPGLFASLVTGNPVALKPHSGAILPAAITVEIAQEVLRETGLPTHIVSLLVAANGERITKQAALRPEVKIIDYTGNSEFGLWLESHATQAQVYTEKAGLNTIVIDDFDNMKGLSRNLSFTLSLYSGQMCTTSQNIFIPKDGINTADGPLSFDDVAEIIATGVNKFLSDPDRAAEVLGAIQSEATLARAESAVKSGEVVLAPEKREHPHFPKARMISPAIIKLDAEKDLALYSAEQFGPITFVIATESTEDSIRRAKQLTLEHGAITWSVYSSNDDVLAATEEAAMEAGVALSCNLTGGVFVNQSAAFSDYHGTGANPSANACLSDSAYVANRFRVVQNRIDVV
jgi:phenylacetic acid degradation protein paaN